VKPKLIKQRGNYYVVSVEGEGTVGHCERSRNFMATSGYAGWSFKPTARGEALGLKGKWETTPKRAVAASMRDRGAVS
jgi:hypothetical protein